VLGRRTVCEIHQLKGQGLSIRQISRDLGVNRETVNEYLKHPEKTMKLRNRPSKIDLYKPFIENLLGEYPEAPPLLLLKHLQQNGFTGKISILRDYLKRTKRKYSNCKAGIRFGDFISPNR
jgi:transposase